MLNRSLSIRQALLGLILSVGLPLIFLAIILMRQSLNSERNAIRDSHVAAARAFAALVDSEIETHLTLAAALAASRALASGDLAEFHTQATQVAQETGKTWISLSDREGRPLLSTLRPFGDALPLRTASKYAVDAAVASRRPFLSDVVPGEVSGRHIAILEYPVIQSGEVVYTISVTLQPETFRKLIAEKYGSNAAVAVIDRQRRFVARMPDHDSRVGTPIAASWLAAIEASPAEGFTESVTLEGVPSLTSYAATRDGWIAGISYPLETLYAPVNRQLWFMTTLGGVFVLMVVALAFGLSRRLETPLKHLAQDADSLSRGELVKPVRLGIREADDISRSLSQSSETLRDRMAELEAAREHQSFLLSELAHRLKNQLTVVNSMIRQTARGRSDITEFASVLGERLHGLAAGIDLLVRQQWREAPVRELVERQVAPFLPSDDRIVLEGPDVRLAPERTQAIGLALHELATNAVKYGAWSTAGGIVRVTWAVSECDESARLTLTWRETGGPVVAAPGRRGFGHAVIEQAAGPGDGCATELRFEPAGVVWTLTTRL